jgi:hypothetical protein
MKQRKPDVHSRMAFARVHKGVEPESVEPPNDADGDESPPLPRSPLHPGNKRLMSQCSGMGTQPY